MPINAETKLPQLLLDYVESRRVALGLPAATVLPFTAGVVDGVHAYPEVVFYCDSFEITHPEKMNLNVAVTLITDRSVVESADESSYAAMIRSALCDVSAFMAWLLTLSSGDRTGWRIQKYRATGGGIEIDAEMSQRRRRTNVVAHMITSENAFPA